MRANIIRVIRTSKLATAYTVYFKFISSHEIAFPQQTKPRIAVPFKTYKLEVVD